MGGLDPSAAFTWVLAGHAATVAGSVAAAACWLLLGVTSESWVLGEDQCGQTT